MKERNGYRWVETSTGGYWSKITGPAHKHKHDFFCAHCRKITSTCDDEYLEEYGFCYECFTMYVDEREKPVIDVDYYRKLKISNAT